MTINHQIFSGIFADEIGQRFLRIHNTAVDNAFKELYDSCHLSHPKKSKCIQIVNNVDKLTKRDIYFNF